MMSNGDDKNHLSFTPGLIVAAQHMLMNVHVACDRAFQGWSALLTSWKAQG